MVLRLSYHGAAPTADGAAPPARDENAAVQAAPPSPRAQPSVVVLRLLLVVLCLSYHGAVPAAGGAAPLSPWCCACYYWCCASLTMVLRLLLLVLRLSHHDAAPAADGAAPPARDESAVVPAAPPSPQAEPAVRARAGADAANAGPPTTRCSRRRCTPEEKHDILQGETRHIIRFTPEGKHTTYYKVLA